MLPRQKLVHNSNLTKQKIDCSIKSIKHFSKAWWPLGHHHNSFIFLFRAIASGLEKQLHWTIIIELSQTHRLHHIFPIFVGNSSAWLLLLLFYSHNSHMHLSCAACAIGAIWNKWKAPHPLSDLTFLLHSRMVGMCNEMNERAADDRYVSLSSREHFRWSCIARWMNYSTPGQFDFT